MGLAQHRLAAAIVAAAVAATAAGFVFARPEYRSPSSGRVLAFPEAKAPAHGWTWSGGTPGFRFGQDRDAWNISLLQPAELASARRSAAAAGVAPLVISASAGTGLDALVGRLVDVLAAEREAAAGRSGFELFRTERRALSVGRDDDGAWRVTGGSVERWVAMCDLGNPQAVAHLQERLDRAGVERLLSEAGANPGDDVRIGEKAFEWWPSTSQGATRT